MPKIKLTQLVRVSRPLTKLKGWRQRWQDVSALKQCSGLLSRCCGGGGAAISPSGAAGRAAPWITAHYRALSRLKRQNKTERLILSLPHSLIHSFTSAIICGYWKQRDKESEREKPSARKKKRTINGGSDVWINYILKNLSFASVSVENLNKCQMPLCVQLFIAAVFSALVIVQEISNLHSLIIVDCLSRLQDVSIFQGWQAVKYLKLIYLGKFACNLALMRGTSLFAD